MEMHKRYLHISTAAGWCLHIEQYCTAENRMNGQESKAKTVYSINRLDGAGLKLHVVEADVLGLLQHVQTPTREGVEPMAADLGHTAQRSAAWERSSFCFCCHTAMLPDAWEKQRYKGTTVAGRPVMSNYHN